MTRRSSYLAGIVFKTGKFSILDVDSELNTGSQRPPLFKNRDWILKNDIQRVACIPLRFAKEILGTLTIYTRYKYAYDTTTEAILTHIVASLVSCATRLLLADRLEQSEEVAHEYRNSLVASSQLAVSRDVAMTLSHFVNNEILTSIITDINKIVEFTVNKNFMIPDLASDMLKRIIAYQSHLVEFAVPEERSEIDFAMFLAKATAYYQHELRSKSIKVEYYVDGKLNILASRHDLDVILHNLVVNSARAIELIKRPEGYIRISAQQGSGQLRILVSDNGIGTNVDPLDGKSEHPQFNGGNGWGLYFGAFRHWSGCEA